MIASCHEILGLPRDATPGQVDAAYLALAMRTHPDHHPEEPARTIAALRFRQAGEAYRVLVDGMSMGSTVVDRDALARATFVVAVTRRAGALARDGSGPEPVARRLVAEGCPPRLAWLLAGQSVMDERLARAKAAALTLMADRDPVDDVDRVPAPLGSARRVDGRDGAQPPPRPPALRPRVAAATADALLLCGLVGAPVALLAWHLDASGAGMQRAAVLALLVAGTVYHVGAETGWGATLGKRLFGLRVTTANGRPIDARCALARHGVRTAAHFTLGLPFLAALLDDLRQAPQELLTSTRVRWDGVDRSELERPLAALPAAVVAFFVLYRVLVSP
jgi:uncharacterized RDD family membrane protein YckC